MIYAGSEGSMTFAAFRRTLRMAFADWTEHKPSDEEIAYYWRIASKYDGSFDKFIGDKKC